jgi:hypothetical protein
MGSNESRIGATFFVWFAFAAIMIWGNLPENDMVPITAIQGAIAGASMFAIWRGANNTAADAHQAQTTGARTTEKAKRSERTRVARLADVLDDEEAAALMTELKSRLALPDDGEAPSLEALLTEREQRTGRQ